MATTDKTTLKNWFRNKLKPTQEQFWAWMNSYWHKSEQIPTSQIESLDTILNAKATTDELNNLSNQVADELNTMNQQLVLVNDELGGKVDIEEGKQLSTEDFTTLLKQKLEVIDMSTKLDRGNYAGTGEDLYNDIQNILAVLASDDTTLDELQEIVNYIKQNKSDLENLGIANIAGLVDALAAKVDVVPGKQLSTEDYTTTEKNKLTANGATMGQVLTALGGNASAWKGATVQALAGNVLDMMAADIFTKTITTATTFTVSNPVAGRDLLLVLTGNYAATLPGTKIDGSKDYDGTVNNYILMTCIDAVTPSFIFTILQGEA